MIGDFDYFWLDFLVGVRLQYGTATDGTWGEAEIWNGENCLPPPTVDRTSDSRVSSQDEAIPPALGTRSFHPEAL
jgi:hypothetical protein